MPERTKSRLEGAAKFVHLHNHTEYSLLDGASGIKPLIKLAASFKMPALAITDHGNLFGAIEFYKTCQESGIKPIIGCEVYLAPFDRKEHKIHSDIPESSFHLTLLCEDLDGYQNLIKLVSAAYLDGFYYRPRIDKEILSQNHKGLIGLSGCWKGEVNYYLRRNDFEKAKAAAKSYEDIFGKGSFYLELMTLGLKEDEIFIPNLLKISKDLEIPIVATQDCHYLKKEDSKAHDVLLCIQTGKSIKDKARLHFESTEVYFKSPTEMAQSFQELPQALENSLRVAERCNLLLPIGTKRFHLPHASRPEEFNSDFEYFAHLVDGGLKTRYREIRDESPIRQRANYELDVIKKMGFASYFLVVKDIVDFAKRQKIPVGPGRGSAAGSLVLYALGITDIDPLKYGLLFERFLTPDRITLPDIDIDFADDRRQEVIDYIRTRYGSESVAQIITFGTMQARAVVRDVGRALDIPLQEVDRIAKLIPFGLSLDEALKQVPDLKNLLNSKSEYLELLNIAKSLEGLPRHASIHASGVVITPKPMLEFVPLYKSQKGDICTQYDMKALDSLGLLKLDILGLRTLTVIEETKRLIKEPEVEMQPVPLDDKKTFELLKRAETTGVFQLESSGMREILKQSSPEKFEDLIAVISLYRPGPLGKGVIGDFIKRKLGYLPVSYPHPSLREILKETYGIIVYQEQVMQISQVISNFTPAQADRLRRAMGKKIPEEMAAMADSFIEGAKKNRINPDIAQEIWNSIEHFAGYGFNKSHSAGYAHLSYLTAYLKANYPIEFICATLTSEIGNSDKIEEFIKEARRMKIPVLAPDVNRSFYPFTIENKKIRFGLGGIRNLGRNASEAIVTERKNGEYQSVRDFLKRTRGFINRKGYESLIKSGALDLLDSDRQKLLQDLTQELARVTSPKKESLGHQISIWAMERKVTGGLGLGVGEKRLATLDTDFEEWEKEAFGFYFSKHPLEKYEPLYRQLNLKAVNRLASLKDGTRVKIGGIIKSKKIKQDKFGSNYALLELEDLSGITEVVVFNDLLKKTNELLKTGARLIIKGQLRIRAEDEPQVRAESINQFEEPNEVSPSQLVINLNKKDYYADLLYKIKEQLLANPGNTEVYLEILGENPRREKLAKYRINPNPTLLEGLKELVGPDAVRLTSL